MSRSIFTIPIHNLNPQLTPALVTSQPQCECPETIPTPSSLIHTADDKFVCPGKYRWGIFAQLRKFQGNLQTRENGKNEVQN